MFYQVSVLWRLSVIPYNRRPVAVQMSTTLGTLQKDGLICEPVETDRGIFSTF
jgi:hypothetical protein